MHAVSASLCTTEKPLVFLTLQASACWNLIPFKYKMVKDLQTKP